MAAFAGKRQGPRKVAWDCGVPPESCKGAAKSTNKGGPKDYKAHGDYDSAIRCQRNYVINIRQEHGLLMSKPQACKAGKGTVQMPPKFRG
jgi:hypothetical protein